MSLVLNNWPRLNFCAYAGWSESAHFKHVRRHFFTWRGPDSTPCFCLFLFCSVLYLFSYCSLTNLAGQQTKPAGSGPVFVQKPQIKQAENKIIFECKLTADPKPSITWLQGNKTLADGGRYKMSHLVDKNTHTISLEITGIGIQDGGEYKVLAKNNSGEATATINLNLEGRKMLALVVKCTITNKSNSQRSR